VSTLPGVERLLVAWLPSQRWFAGKDLPVDGVEVLAETVLPQEHTAALVHLVVGVHQGERRSAYQVPLVARHAAEDRLGHVWLGTDDLGRHVYDALHDRDVTGWFGAAVADETRLESLRAHRAAGAARLPTAASLVLPVEQSNTSLAFGDQALLKVFRRLAPGENPDIEVHAALARVDCAYVAPLLGWLDGAWRDPDGEDTLHGSLAMLQTFLTTATDGWRLARGSVQDLFAEADLHAEEVGGDFSAESERLGAATAHVHADLARTLPTAVLSGPELESLAEGMLSRLAAAAAEVADLEPLADTLAAELAEVATVGDAVSVQRVHGDYHLGQVMRDVLGWRLLDFEGEPETPLPERRRLDSPLRDVAGMLRSFDYCAGHVLAEDHPGDAQLAFRAREWVTRNQEAFCVGYASVAGHDPREQGVLLAAYEIDKAVYEAIYEQRNRPAWLGIPMAALHRLAQHVPDPPPAGTPTDTPTDTASEPTAPPSTGSPT